MLFLMPNQQCQSTEGIFYSFLPDDSDLYRSAAMHILQNNNTAIIIITELI